MFKRYFLHKKRSWLVFFCIMFFLFFTGDFLYFRERAVTGLFIKDQYIGGKTFTEIEEVLDSLAGEMRPEIIHFNLPDDKGKIAFSLEEIGLELDKERLMEELKGFSKPLNYTAKFKLLFNGLTIPAFFKADHNKIRAAFSRINNEICLLPVEAKVWADKGMLRFSPPRKGQRAKVALLQEEIFKKCYWPPFPLDIHVEVEPVYPEVTMSDLLASGIKEEITKTSTLFNLEAKNRVHNIALAAQRVDNLLLKPGSVFSFNAVVGETLAQDGFKEAPVIVNDQLTLGIGGGICQLSSTLYNSALKAGLTIVERHNHGLPVAYLPPGLDATVAYDYLDLKFKNNLETTLLIHVNIVDNQLNVHFFGDPEHVGEIKIQTANQQQIPPPVHFRNCKDKPVTHREKVQEGKPGVTVEVYRIFYQQGREIKREYLGKDYYSPVPEIWEIGQLPDAGKE